MPKGPKRATPPPSRVLRRDFSLGAGQAETDNLLHEAFYRSAQYRILAARDDKRCFLIGRTGSGKSASLQKLEEEHAGHVIRINPQNLSLPYITNVNVVKYLSDLGVNLDLFFSALWKHVLLIEIIKHRYNVDSPEATQRFLSALIERVRRDESKKAALAYLEEFEGKFWVEADERVRDITRKLEDQVKQEAGGKLSLAGSGELSFSAGGNSTGSVEDKVELVQRFQRIINDTQLSKLNKMMTVLNDDILDSPQHFSYIIVDDLDLDWVESRVASDLIRCLFRVVLELSRVEHLKVLVALRTNIFEALDFGRAGGQEEKFRDLTLRMQWNKGELEELLDSRVRVAAARLRISGVNKLQDLLPIANRQRGNAITYVLRRTLLRPRDAITFFNMCFEMASSKERLTWEDITAAENDYSANRLLALRDEWKPTYPDIDRVFKTFVGTPVLMDLECVTRCLDDCIMLAADPSFDGKDWLGKLSSTALGSNSGSDWAEIYHPLIRMLYNIGFLGYLTGSQKTPVYNYDKPTFADRLSNIREVTAFVVHPAFRPDLDVRQTGKSPDDS